MTCLAEERFVDLLDRGGLDAVSPEEQTHLEECESCRDAWATVAAAGEVLTEARPKGGGRAVRLVPLIAAAAILLTIVGLIAARKSAPPVTQPIRDPLTLFVEGTPEEAKGAREALLKSGKSALPGLVAVRPKWRSSVRWQELQDLIWAIKRDNPQESGDLNLLNKLETMKMDLQFEKARVGDVLFFMRDFSGLNLILDPSLDDGMVDFLSLKDATLRSVLEMLCGIQDLDFDVKYGVVFLSRPLRLWSTDPAVGLPRENLWRTGISGPGDAALGDKLRSVRTTMDITTSPLSAVAQFIGETASLKVSVSPEIAERPITLKFANLTVDHAIELLTLPSGWDARIDHGSVVLFSPKK